MPLKTTQTLDLKIQFQGWGIGSNRGVYSRLYVNGTTKGTVNGQDTDDFSDGLGGIIFYTATGDGQSRDRTYILDDRDLANFSTIIESLPFGTIVALVVKRSFLGFSFTEREYAAISSLGSALIRNVQLDDRWALIGQKGAAPGMVHETLSKDDASIQSQMRYEVSSPQLIAIQAQGAGSGAAGEAFISIDYAPVQFQGFSIGDGINALALSTLDGTILSARNFNILSDATQVQAFVQFLNAQNQGDIFVIATKGLTGTSMTQAIKDACLLRLGSTQTDKLSQGGAWSLIGSIDDWSKVPAEAYASAGNALCGTWTSIGSDDDTGFDVIVRSAGGSWGNAAQVLINDYPVLDSDEATDGINMVSIDPGSGTLYSRLQDAPDPFHFLTAVPPGFIVALVIKGNVPASSMTDTSLRAILQSIGVSIWRNYESGSSYALIGRKGTAPGAALEMLSKQAAVSLSIRFSLSRDLRKPFIQVQAYSSGKLAEAAIHIDGDRVDIPNMSGTGLSCVKFDQVGNLLLANCFDMQSTTDVTNFADLIQNTEPDTHFAIISHGNPSSHDLPDGVKNAIASLGGTRTKQDNWALIGKKGASAQAVVESYPISPTEGTTECKTLIPYKPEPDAGFKLVAQAGYTAAVYLNGVLPNVSFGRGINIVTFDPADGTLRDRANFDLSGWGGGPSLDESNLAMAQFIEALPSGRIVAIVTYRHSNPLSERNIYACKTLGSELASSLGKGIDNWALIGYKGAAPGSVIESGQSSTTEFSTLSIGAWMPYFTIDNGQQQPRLGNLIIIAGAVTMGVGMLLNYLYHKATSTTRQAALQFPMPEPGKPRAVFVGIDYIGIQQLGLQDKKTGERLGGKFSHSFRRAMIDMGYFKENNTILLNEQESGTRFSSWKNNVMDALKWLVKDAKGGDVLCFYYFGHGAKTFSGGNIMLMTLAQALNDTDAFQASEFQDIIKNISPKVNLTCVLHCCYGGGMIDDSTAAGRGICIASVDENAPSKLLDTRNLTNLIISRTKYIRRVSTDTNSDPSEIYNNLFTFIRTNINLDSPILKANSQLYDLTKLRFLRPIL